MKYTILVILGFLVSCQGASQDSIGIELNNTHRLFKEDSLNHKRFKHSTLLSLIDELRKDERFDITQVGRSMEGLPLNMISLGQGNVDIFLWSQMRGNEPTGTQAIFDIMNFFESDTLSNYKDVILSKTRLHFLAMVNPDGAEKFQKHNALGIDVYNDALRLQSPEGQILKRIRDSLEADFGFGLLGQGKYSHIGLTKQPTALSYSAPAHSDKKETNSVLERAKKLAGYMKGLVEQFAPGQISRQKDDFEPRGFGHNFQKWGTSTIIIESGRYSNDSNNHEIRKLNFVSILSGIYSIATETYKQANLSMYDDIPIENHKLFDVKISGVLYEIYGKNHVIDLGINLEETNTPEFDDYSITGRVVQLGDLSTYSGRHDLNAKGMQILQGSVYGQTFETMEDLKELNFSSLLRAGYTYLRVRQIPPDLIYSPYPINIISANYEVRDLRLEPNVFANFSLVQDGQAVYTILNGFVIDVNTNLNIIKNGQIYR